MHLWYQETGPCQAREGKQVGSVWETCGGGGWRSQRSHVSFCSRTLAWDMRMKSWWHVNSWMRSRTGLLSALRGDNSIASIALRYILDVFILHIFCVWTQCNPYHHWTGGWHVIISEFIPEATLLEFERRVRVLKTYFFFGCAFGTPSVVSFFIFGCMNMSTWDVRVEARLKS